MSTPHEEPLVPPSARPPSATGGQPQAGPPSASGYASGYGYAAPASPPPDAQSRTDAEAALRKARTALGWAIGASVGALLALLAAFIVPTVLDVDDAFYVDAGYPVRGGISSYQPGRTLTGSSVASAVEDALLDDGADVDRVDCPDTAAPQVSSVIACRGAADGEDWTFVVYLLDESGSILVTQY